MQKPIHSAETIAGVVLGIVVIALLVVALGFWAWSGTTISTDYSELFWDTAPHVEGENVAFAIHIRSHELQDMRWDVNVYLNGEEVSRKKVQLLQGQEKKVDFSIPIEDLQGNMEVKIIAQRFDGLGAPLKTRLEIRDWARVADMNGVQN